MKKSIKLLLVLLLSTITVWIVYQKKGAQTINADEQITEVVIYKNPGCLCCDKWADHLEENGFKITSIKEHDDMIAFKESKNIPLDKSSCHTAVIEGYSVEGHVPASDIKRLLQKGTEGVGLTTPGMPAKAPGMDLPSSDTYDVLFIDSKGETTLFATH